MRTTTQTTTISVELADAYADGARRVRKALGADGAGVVGRKLPFGFEVFAFDSAPGFELETTMSAALIDVVHQSSRTLTPTRIHSIVLAPIVAEGEVVAALHVARRSALGFTPQEIRTAEAIAKELGTAAAQQEDDGRRKTLQRVTIMNLLAADSDSIEWDEAGDENGSAIVFGPALDASMANVGLRSALTETLNRLLSVTEAHIAAVVLGADPMTVLAVGVTDHAPDLPAERLISKTIVSQVIETGLPMLTLDAPDDSFAGASASIMGLSVATVMGIPLAAPRHGGTIGVLYSATFNSTARIHPETIETVMGDARTIGPMLAAFCGHQS